MYPLLIHRECVRYVNRIPDVSLVPPQPGRPDFRAVDAGLGVIDAVPRDLVEPGNVVEDGAGSQNENAGPGAAVSAQGPGLEGLAHRHVALDGDAEGEIGGGGLCDQTDRVDERGDVGKDLPVVVGEGASVRVDRGEAEH